MNDNVNENDNGNEGIEKEYRIAHKLSLNKLLKYTGEWNRIHTCIKIEQIYVDLMNEFGIIKSDLINDLLESYFKDLNLIDIMDFLDEKQKEKLREKKNRL